MVWCNVYKNILNIAEPTLIDLFFIPFQIYSQTKQIELSENVNFKCDLALFKSLSSLEVNIYLAYYMGFKKGLFQNFNGTEILRFHVDFEDK